MGLSRKARFFCVTAMVAIAGFATAGVASAAPFTMTLDNGQLNLGAVFKGKTILPAPVPGSLGANTTANATIAGDNTGGALTVTAANVKFPIVEVPNPLNPAQMVPIMFSVSNDLTGTYDAVTGAVSLSVAHMASDVVTGTGSPDPLLPATCHIAPIDVTFSSTNTAQFIGVPFTAGIEGNGAIAASWTTVPAGVEVNGGDCSTVNTVTAGKGGLWLSHGIVTPPVPSCASDPTLCVPAIGSVKVNPKSKTVKAGKSVTLKAKVTNTGDGEATGVKVCATGNKKQVKVPKCQTKTIAAGGSTTVKLKVKVQKKAKKGKAKVTVKASSADAGSKTGKSTIKIKPLKKHKKH